MRYDGESPLVFLVSRNQVLRIRNGAPAVVTSHTHLLHVDAYFHKIARSDVVDVRLAWFDVAGRCHIMLPFFFVAVLPLIVAVSSFFTVKVFYRVAQGIETDSLVSISSSLSLLSLITAIVFPL